MHAGDKGSLAPSPPVPWGHLIQTFSVEMTIKESGLGSCNLLMKNERERCILKNAY